MAKKTDNNAAFLEKFKECEQLIRQTYGDDKNFKWFEDKMKDDGEFYDRLNQLFTKTCAAGSQLDANCSRRQEQLGQHQKALDFITSYYADTLIDMGTTYDKPLIEPQVAVVLQQMAARGKTNLNGYLDTYWKNLQGYWKDGKVAREAWQIGRAHV